MKKMKPFSEESSVDIKSQNIITGLVETGSGIYNTHNYAKCHARLLGVSAYCSFVLQPMWEDFFLIYQYYMCLFRGP